ncbi:HNH endonuclease [Mycobacteroides abscessus]|uniref:HNH endonuclease n=1 Tax=Mycobacteroides abscessus TaxID=36809 RepID=UPI0007F9779C|nr:HNH endonuclease [Mycobacteroides abscessus]ANO12796.1 hypothetical protein BAB77_02045 [Mycobacteroides abscessus]MBE5447538.1 hypothetical protein [Mycobacteroides abscessus]MBE5514159.1 hypothetical protein [Mycobacteroides abscessus]MBN7511782.1 HNH endonuclease [Mycobacteroides abscessus subsp. massiliense]MDM2138102.1 HNH endonuclease [Mycobacteroides abscessus]
MTTPVIPFARDTRVVPILTAEDAARFWDRVQVNDGGCWVWTGAVGHNGYGNFYVSGAGTYRAHRVSWVWANGDVPHGFDLDHAVCRNKVCVNPEHLEVVTVNVNTWRGQGHFWSRDMQTLIRRVLFAKGDIDTNTFTTAAVQLLLNLGPSSVKRACSIGELRAHKGEGLDKRRYTPQWHIDRADLIDFIINRAAEDAGAPVLRALITERTAA